MKNFLTVTIFISGILFFASCKKDNSALTPQVEEEIATQKVKLPSTPTRVKTDVSSFGTRTFTYNADFLSTGNTGLNPTVYTYPDATHIIETPSNGSVKHYQLNKKGLIETATTPYITEYWSFNNKKQLTEILTKSNSSSDVSILKYVYNSDNNLDTLSDISNGNVSWYETFTYTDQPNVLSEETFGEGFKGLGSKNLIKTSTYHSGSTVVTTNFSYEYDPFGRVIKASYVVNGNPQPYHLYTYY
jgi:hypothetical protein